MSPRPIPEIIRDLVVFTEREDFGPVTFAKLAASIRGRVIASADPQHALDALEAASILRRLDDGTLDVATLLDEPCSNIDAAREACVAQYEAQLDGACRALAGES